MILEVNKMEKTNELNKFLSYIHMGQSIYRIYYEEAKKFECKTLEDLIVKIMEKFKGHEEKISSLIEDEGECATDSLTMAGVMGVYKERMKLFSTVESIITSAIKSTNMGLISGIKFIHDNNELPKTVKEAINKVLLDYNKIESMLIDLAIHENNK